MGTNERIIMIKGDAGKWYNQAIFIVNKDLPDGKIPVDFVAEAEKIITNYLQKKKQPPLKSPPYYKPAPVKAVKTVTDKSGGKKFDFIINVCMLLGCLMIVAALTLGLTG